MSRWDGRTPPPDGARAYCGGCRRPDDPQLGLVFWAADVTNSNRTVPLDWRPTPDGEWIVMAAGRTAERFTRKIRPGEAWPGGRFTSHWDTCTGPKRGQRRKTRARKTENVSPDQATEAML